MVISKNIQSPQGVNPYAGVMDQARNMVAPAGGAQTPNAFANTTSGYDKMFNDMFVGANIGGPTLWDSSGMSGMMDTYWNGDPNATSGPASFGGISGIYKNALQSIKDYKADLAKKAAEKANGTDTATASEGSGQTSPEGAGGVPSNGTVAATTNPKAKKLAEEAKKVALNMGGSQSQGKCLAGTTKAFNNIGLPNMLGTMSAKDADKHLTKENGFKLVDTNTLQEGDVIVYENDGHGHIEVALANGQGASDYVGGLNLNNSRYKSYKVYRLIENA